MNIQYIARGGAYRVGFGLLILTVFVNLLGALGAGLASPILTAILGNLAGYTAGEQVLCVYLTLRAILTYTAILWIVGALLWSFSDTQSGKITRDHGLEMGGRLGFSYTLLALTVTLCEMFFHH